MKKTAFSTGAFYTLETAEALGKIRKAGFEHAELMPQCQEDLSPVMLQETNMHKAMETKTIKNLFIFLYSFYSFVLFMISYLLGL